MEQTAVKYSLVHYDVPDGEKLNHDVYQVIYKHLFKVAVQLSGSVYYFNAEKEHLVDVAFSKTNDELRRKNKRPIHYGVIPVDKAGWEAAREWTRKSLREKAQHIAASLLESIEKLDDKFHTLIDEDSDDKPIGMIFQIKGLGFHVIHNCQTLPVMPGFTRVTRSHLKEDNLIFIDRLESFLTALAGAWSP